MGNDAFSELAKTLLFVHLSLRAIMAPFGSRFGVSPVGAPPCIAAGFIVDGIPPGLAVSEQDIQRQLTRRRPGQSSLTTPRDEKEIGET